MGGGWSTSAPPAPDASALMDGTAARPKMQLPSDAILYIAAFAPPSAVQRWAATNRELCSILGGPSARALWRSFVARAFGPWAVLRGERALRKRGHGHVGPMDPAGGRTWGARGSGGAGTRGGAARQRGKARRGGTASGAAGCAGESGPNDCFKLYGTVAQLQESYMRCFEVVRGGVDTNVGGCEVIVCPCLRNFHHHANYGAQGAVRRLVGEPLEQALTTLTIPLNVLAVALLPAGDAAKYVAMTVTQPPEILCVRVLTCVCVCARACVCVCKRACVFVHTRTRTRTCCECCTFRVFVRARTFFVKVRMARNGMDWSGMHEYSGMDTPLPPRSPGCAGAAPRSR
jgi:hypothetical protein